MPRYIVAVYGSRDGLIFPDLLVTYSSGLKFELRVKKGDYIPVELFDPLDIKKSLLTGCLKSFIESGAVQLEFSDLEKKNRKRKNKVQKKKKLPSIEEEPSNLPKEVQKKELPQTKPEETQVVTEKDLNFTDVKTVEDFSKLSYFRKTKFVTQSKDKSLLNEILNKDFDSHIKNTIIFHLQK